MTWLWVLILIVVAPPVLLAGRAQYQATQEYRRWQEMKALYGSVGASVSGAGTAFLGLGVSAARAAENLSALQASIRELTQAAIPSSADISALAEQLGARQ